MIDWLCFCTVSVKYWARASLHLSFNSYIDKNVPRRVHGIPLKQNKTKDKNRFRISHKTRSLVHFCLKTKAPCKYMMCPLVPSVFLFIQYYYYIIKIDWIQHLTWLSSFFIFFHYSHVHRKNKCMCVYIFIKNPTPDDLNDNFCPPPPPNVQKLFCTTWIWGTTPMDVCESFLYGKAEKKIFLNFFLFLLTDFFLPLNINKLELSSAMLSSLSWGWVELRLSWV